MPSKTPVGEVVRVITARFKAQDVARLETIADYHETTLSQALRMLVKKEAERIEGRRDKP